jgi:hypothetical protein
MHAPSGGDVQLQRGRPPGPTEHARQDVLTRAIQRVPFHQPRRSFLTQPSDTERQTDDVSRDCRVGGHSREYQHARW